MPASVTKSPFWNDNTPPLLKNVAFGEISRAHVVAGDVAVTRALFAMNPWEQLPAYGGRLAVFPFVANMYFGVVAWDGRVFPNPAENQLRPVGFGGNVQLWEAEISQWSEWHLIAPPITEGADHTYNVTEEVTMETSTLESRAKEIAASASVTASYNGVFASASVTASLSATFSSSVSSQKTFTTSKTMETTRVHKANYAYANWHKYDVYEISYENGIIDPIKAPFTSDQLNAINPGRLRIPVLTAIWNDSCAEADLIK